MVQKNDQKKLIEPLGKHADGRQMAASTLGPTLCWQVLLGPQSAWRAPVLERALPGGPHRSTHSVPFLAPCEEKKKKEEISTFTYWKQWSQSKNVSLPVKSSSSGSSSCFSPALRLRIAMFRSWEGWAFSAWALSKIEDAFIILPKNKSRISFSNRTSTKKLMWSDQHISNGKKLKMRELR